MVSRPALLPSCDILEYLQGGCLIPIWQIVKLRPISLFVLNTWDEICWRTSFDRPGSLSSEGRWLLEATHLESGRAKPQADSGYSNIYFMASRIMQKWPQDHGFLTLAESHLDSPWAQPMALNRSQECYSPGNFWPGTYLQNSRGDGNIPTHSLQTQISNFLVLYNLFGNANYVILV